MSPTLPRLELDLSDMDSPFDEAVLLINGHEEETIRIECNGAGELAERLMLYVNAHQRVLDCLQATSEVLRRFGGETPEIDALIKTIGEAA